MQSWFFIMRNYYLIVSFHTCWGLFVIHPSQVRGWALTFCLPFVTLAAVLWCFGSHIYGVSEGQWRLLPEPARRVCRRVKCRPTRSYLTKEACTETWTLAGSRDSKRERPHQQSKSGWGKSPKVHCPSRPSPPRSQEDLPCFEGFFPLVPSLPP